MSEVEPEPLPKDDMPSERIRMQSTTEQGRRDRSRIPLDVKFENLQALFDSVVKSTTIASAESHEPSDQVTARSFGDGLILLSIWSLNLKTAVPEADPRVSNLRILGKLDGPLVATPVNILEGIEKALRVLSAGATNNRLVFGEQFRATCDKVKASIDRLLSLQDALVEELTTKKDEVRTILSEESDPAKHRLPLICFDGGGVCSYSGLLIFEALMHEVRSVITESEGEAIAKSVRPHDVFRYMFGASTGGWIAIMLGRLNMTDVQCRKTFRTYTESIFRCPRRLYYVFGGLTTSKYSGQSLIRATEDVTESFNTSPVSLYSRCNMFASDAEICQCGVGVFAYAEPESTPNFGVPYLFRTYKNTSSGARNPGKADNYHIWDVALAATAASSYFPVAKFDDKAYSDGSFGANNPSWEAFQELSYLHPSNPLCLVSIGSGTHTAFTRWPSFALRFHRDLVEKVRLAKGTESVHELMLDTAAHPDKLLSYFRFDVPGLEDVPFDEWTVKRRKQWPNAGKLHTIDFIERQTNRYLAQGEIRALIRTCARMVVDSYCPIYEPKGSMRPRA